jgi:hypothetical protein
VGRARNIRESHEAARRAAENPLEGVLSCEPWIKSEVLEGGTFVDSRASVVSLSESGQRQSPIVAEALVSSTVGTVDQK